MRGANGGPKSKQGKQASSRNALKHGIVSFHSVVIEGIETEDGWQRFLTGFVESLAPEGQLEEELAERIAFLLWRLRRSRHHETAVLNIQVQGEEQLLSTNEAYAQGTLAEGEFPKTDPMKVAAYQQLRIIPDAMTFERIIRYETHVHRLWVQTLHELEALQARRRGQPAYLARVDFSGPPTS